MFHVDQNMSTSPVKESMTASVPVATSGLTFIVERLPSTAFSNSSNAPMSTVKPDERRENKARVSSMEDDYSSLSLDSQLDHDTSMEIDGEFDEFTSTSVLDSKSAHTSDKRKPDLGRDDTQLLFEDRTVAAQQVAKLSKKELEDMILEHMAVVLTATGSVAKMRAKLEFAEEKLEQYRRKTAELINEVKCLNSVLRVFVEQTNKSDGSMKSAVLVPPKKVCRSVGIQVNFLRERTDVGRTDRQPAPPSMTLENEGTRIIQQGFQAPEDLKKRVGSLSSLPNNSGLLPTQLFSSNSAQPSSLKSSSSSVSADKPSDISDSDDDVVVLSDEELGCAELKRSTASPMKGARGSPVKRAHCLPPALPPSTSKVDHTMKPLPPKLLLRASKICNAVNLSWDSSGSLSTTSHHAESTWYQIWLFGETSTDDSWILGNTVRAQPLPMVCKTALPGGTKSCGRYYFAVRAVDVHDREGPFSDPVFLDLP